MTWSPRPPAERPLRTWLTAPGSLTSRIRAVYSGFRVARLRQRAARPFADESALIGVRGAGLAVCRDVVLYAGQRPLVFGHSIVAPRHLMGPWRAVKFLGSRPLAEALYADAAVRRRPLQFARLDARHPLYRRVCADLGSMPATLWARRSLFVRHGAPLLVTEVFLPHIAGRERETLRPDA